jgi:hypothetical protein
MSATDKAVSSAPVGGKIAPLFRRVDWLAMLIAFAAIWLTYLRTLAPELTLEDSGELCTGSFYAGIPHPPGYPFWAIYSWVWTQIVPFGNVAWRVEVGESFAAAMACGLVGLMVSRGSSMLIEGIEDLKNMSGKWEMAICLVSGAVAGILLGLGGTMWSESVAINRISLFGAPWVMLVLACLMRWIYAPKQIRYLFIAVFCFGICATIHQTLLVAALGVETAVALARPRLGRTFFLCNGMVFVTALVAQYFKLTNAVADMDPMIAAIFYAVGLSSIALYIWFSILTKETVNEFLLDLSMFSVMLLPVIALGNGSVIMAGIFGLAALSSMSYFIWQTRKLGYEWLIALICLILWIAGASFYFYEPISGMTNPPMQWGYPRTVEGFFHALSRGQYEKAHPTNLLDGKEWPKFGWQLWGFLVHGIAEEFNWLLTCITVIPFLFFFKMKQREKAWVSCLTMTYFCIGVILVILMNPQPDRSSVDLHRVFFASSHGVIAILFGYGFAIIAAYMATNYQNFRLFGLAGGGIAVVLSLFTLWENIGKHYFGIDGSVNLSDVPHWIITAFNPHQYGMPIIGTLILVLLTIAFLAAMLIYKEKAPLGLTLLIFLGMPLYSGLAHWGTSEQRNHWFGYWFGHDMFTPPNDIYPAMTKNAVLFGGTDPGRFCPTYMIFCESFIPHKDQPKQDQNFDRRDVYIITQNALADPTYLEYIRAHYNRSKQIDPPFFQEFLRGAKERELNYETNFIARTAYEYLDKPLTAFGARVEKRRRAEGVYPPKEIYTPTPEDSTKCFNDYMGDAQQRVQHDMQNPNEPRQVKPGEDVHMMEGNRISVSGQVAVMSINGLLTKVIFDQNPENEFFVEESFPLDWMYPYETPFGIIMKINRQPLEQFTDDIIKRDHDFWSKYSERLIGNWITYDTSVKEICDFIQKVYLRKNFEGFKGDQKFVRDDQAQKAFSKLRSSIGGLYDYRFMHPHDGADQQRMLKEADFTYRQAFAFCPYSPEVVFRYVTLLTKIGRFDDALLVAGACAELDPNNNQVHDLYNQLKAVRDNNQRNPNAGMMMPSKPVAELEKDFAANPNDMRTAAALVSSYLQSQQKAKAEAVMDAMVANPHAEANAVVFVVNYYIQNDMNFAKLEPAFKRLTEVEPHSPEAWRELAALEIHQSNNEGALKALEHAAIENSGRLKQNPKAPDILAGMSTDARFDSVRQMPEFKRITGAK